jgi:chemotaxis protein MotC
MNSAAGFSVFLTLCLLAACPQHAFAANDDAHKHEIAETAPQSSEIADQRSESKKEDDHSSEGVAQKPSEHGQTNEVHAEEKHTEDKTQPQDQSSGHGKTDQPIEAHKDDHAEHGSGQQDHADHAEKSADAHEDDGHSDEHAKEKKLSPLEQCYQVVVSEARASEADSDHSKSEPTHSTRTDQKIEEVEEPYKLIRTLEMVQDKIAAGSRDAHIYQRRLIGEIAGKFLQTPDRYWRSPKNSRAAILYALSGGDARIIQKLLDLSPLPCVDDNLLKGLLAYSKGDNETAKSRLMPIKSQDLDPRTAAHLSLAQAMLIAAGSPREAISYFNFSRILAPGTLIEEAALRRASIIAALTEDFDNFEMLSSQYLRRFSKSVYASEFLSRFAVVVSTSQYAIDDNRFEKVAQMLESLTSDEQRAAYLAIVEAAIVRGKIGLTRKVAKRLADFAKIDPKLVMQAKLYEAAVMIVSEDYDRGVAQLRSIDRVSIPARDQPVLDAALDLSRRMRQPPQVTELTNEPPPVSAEQGKQIEFKQTDKLIDNAETAIGQADDLLNGDRR